MAAVREKQGWRQLASTCLMQWHLCSLDAPTVAVVWSLALARIGAVRLHGVEVPVLGLGTWIVYVLDRVFDGIAPRRPAAGGFDRDSRHDRFRDQLQDRHRFHSRNRRLLLQLCGAASIMLALLCCRLPARLFVFYLVLGAPVAAYGAWVHRRLLWRGRARGVPVRKAKEAAVALLFTAAVAAPALVGAEPASRPGLLAAALLLALLCWLNCALISHAEAPVRFGHAHERRLLVGCALVLAALSATAWGWGQGSLPAGHMSSIGGAGQFYPEAVLLSSLLLLALLLSMREGTIGARKLRVLADLGLLTPLLFMIPRFQK